MQLRVDDGELVDADFAGANRVSEACRRKPGQGPRECKGLQDAAEAWNGKIVLQVAWHSLKYSSMTS